MLNKVSYVLCNSYIYKDELLILRKWIGYQAEAALEYTAIHQKNCVLCKKSVTLLPDGGGCW